MHPPGQNSRPTPSAPSTPFGSNALTPANSREADAQSAFNTLAAVASLGIPALVLALYGAVRLLP